MQINKKMRKYIEDNIFPSYVKNDQGHNLEHIKYVIDRSIKFASQVNDIDYNMVYVILLTTILVIILMLKTMKKYQQKCYLPMKT